MATRGRLVGQATGGGGADSVLLETKLTPPPVRPEHVGRPDLVDRLREGARRRLTVIAAPPGFGKSTLLAAWIAANGAGTIAWLALDGADNDPARFAAYVIAALQRLDPALGARSLAALREPGADVQDVVLPHLYNEVAASGRDAVLVLEDAHLITSHEVQRAVASLVEQSPRTLRIVLSTREDPALPLGRLRAAGELTEIRAEDLRFSDDQATTFLVDGLGLDLSGEDVMRLQARTEGWPAALYLAGLSLRGRQDASAAIEAFAGDDRYVVDFLTSEVLARQPPALRSFLLRTSILDRLGGPLCDAVTERDDSTDRLAELERSNLLVVPLDTRRAWYRYHHLFGDLLRHELQATDPDAVRTLHRRASAWYRDAGMIVDAARHAIAGGDTAAAAEIVGVHHGVFVDQGQLATVIGWLEAIPERMAARDWLLGFAGAVVYAHAGRLDTAERWLAAAGRAPQVEREGQHPAGPLAAMAAALLLLRGDLGGTTAHARRALEIASADDAGWALAPNLMLASAAWWSGGAAEAASVLDVTVRRARHARMPAYQAYALGLAAAIALDEQDEPRARSIAGEAMQVIREQGLEDHPWSAMAWITQGTLAARGGDLATAAQDLERGLALGERLQAWQVIVHACLALAEIRHRRDAPAARRLLTRVRGILDPLPDPGDARERLVRTERALKLRSLRSRSGTPPPFWELSRREMEVLRLLPSDLSQREMAAELFVSFNTVRTHTRVIFGKLGVTSRVEAVARARELGLL